MRKVVLPWYLVIVVLLVVAGLFGLGLYRNHVDSEAAQAQEADLVGRLSRLEERKLELQTTITSVGTEAFVETYVRENMDFMKPGEVRFGVSNPDQLRLYREEEIERLAEQRAIDDLY